MSQAEESKTVLRRYVAAANQCPLVPPLATEGHWFGSARGPGALRRRPGHRPSASVLRTAADLSHTAGRKRLSSGPARPRKGTSADSSHPSGPSDHVAAPSDHAPLPATPARDHVPPGLAGWF